MKLCHAESLQATTAETGRPWIAMFTEDTHHPGLAAGRGVPGRDIPGTGAAGMEFPGSEELRRL